MRFRCGECATWFDAPPSAKRKACSRACHHQKMRRRPGKAELNARFDAKIQFGGVDECWLWQPAIGTHGYGVFGTGGKGNVQCAQRYAYERANGPVPKGLLVLHSCDVRACVNPEHLRVGTCADNVSDMIKRGRAFWQRESTCG